MNKQDITEFLNKQLILKYQRNLIEGLIQFIISQTKLIFQFLQNICLIKNTCLKKVDPGFLNQSIIFRINISLIFKIPI
ncbi:unnamed protein product [Paramecium pentaurelia]|uniref:Uncharacterized protein n=1 Tax=Paramecium pentaurelia TaxID=43138 RepID=A0A8S1TB15_9CILI|nr:unnamed protein product [Paramecium pentaurelia]